MMLSFKADDDNYMSWTLTFSNQGTSQIAEKWSTYLAIDDAAGHNYLRRPLSEVDLRKLAPARTLTFSNRLLIPALKPGHYAIELWIPNPAPSLKFDPSHNFLLSNAGIADEVTGLNKVAVLEVLP